MNPDVAILKWVNLSRPTVDKQQVLLTGQNLSMSREVLRSLTFDVVTSNQSTGTLFKGCQRTKF